MLPEFLQQCLLSLQPIYGEIYLVGGAVRNAFLHITAQDFDFIVEQNSIQLAKGIADFFHGDFFVLDKSRGTARALISINGEQLKIDTTQMVGGSITADLSKRDFTINAIAVRLSGLNETIDPLSGELDIQKSILRTCSSTSLRDDPVRVIRAVRFINQFNLSFKPINIDRLHTAALSLYKVSGERKRDEFIKILEKTDVNQSLIYLSEFGILENIFPEVMKLQNVELDPPHVHTVWGHTLKVITYCQQFVDLFTNKSSIEKAHKRIQQAFKELKVFQGSLIDYLNVPIHPERSKMSLLLLAGIFHDTGKGVIEPVFGEKRKSYPKHAKISSDLIKSNARKMGFSKKEIEFLSAIVQFHMKPSRQVFIDEKVKDLHVYRFIKKVGSAGILIGLLHVADVLATYEESITDARWDQAIKAIKNIFDAYFLRSNEIIDPPKLINGKELMNEFHLSKGKEIGLLLELVVEAQVMGIIHSKEQAIKLISEHLKNKAD